MALEALVKNSDTLTSMGLKTPPHSLEAEQSVLGGLLYKNDAFDSLSGVLVVSDFYRRSHQIIYEGITGLVNQGAPCDVVILSEYLESRGQLEEVGGIAYLTEIVQSTPAISNLQAYAKIVKERAILRSLISVAQDIAEMAYEPEGRAAAELLDSAEQLVFDIANRYVKTNAGPRRLEHLLTKAVERIDALFQADSPITGQSTGFNDLDDLTSGLQQGDLVIVAGRPSMGKTTFAMNMAENVGVKFKKPVLVFSMEMPAESLAMRMLSSVGRINQHKVRTGQLQDDDWPRLSEAVGILAEAPVYIDDTPALTPSEVRSRARRLAREHKDGLGAILIDYLQLMRVHGYKDNRVGEISEISRSLKSLAKELHVPIIALSQLNRGLESRPNKRPVMSDLRESGAIEQDADVIMFIYRDEVYHEDSPDKGMAEIIISKQRNGPIGTIRLTFLGQYTRFENHIQETRRFGD